MSRSREKIYRRTAHIRDYFRYKFPFLSVFTGRAKWPLITSVLALLCSALYYAIKIPSPTPNSVLDGLIATPLQAAIVSALVASVAWVRIYFYRGTKGSAERNTVDHSSATSYLWVPLSPKIRELFIDCQEISEMKELHPIIESAIQFTDFDKEENFRLEAGTLNIPKCAMLSMQLASDHATLFVSSTSFYAIYYSHYFADYRLSRDSTDENTKAKGVSLRSVFGMGAENYIREQITLTLENKDKSDIEIHPYPIFPNPLGVTGICFFKDQSGEQFYIARHRAANVINEGRRLDWSFSGLVEAHTFFKPRNHQISLKEFVGTELTDELLKPILVHAAHKEADGDEPLIEPASHQALGLVFNGKYLFQPELVVLIELKTSLGGVSAINAYANETGQIKLFSRSDLFTLDKFGLSKDLFTPIKKHLVEFLAQTHGARG